MTANAIIGTVVSDYCWARSVVLNGPLITSLGITLTFPISLTIDVLKNGETFSWQYYIGSVLIFAAFGGIITINWREDQKKQNEKNDISLVTL